MHIYYVGNDGTVTRNKELVKRCIGVVEAKDHDEAVKVAKEKGLL